MHKKIQQIVFKDPESLSRIEAILGEPDSPLAEPLANALGEAADPDRVIVGLQRFLDSAINQQSQRHLMEAVPRYLHLVATILDQSHYLTDIVCRNPEYMAWLWEEAELERARTQEEMTEDLRHQVSAFDRFEARCESMRRFKRREILRIAVRDIFTYAEMGSITEDLSNLADAALQVAIESASTDLVRRFGTPREASNPEEEAAFVILGLGKHGGRELNFSSDIDLIFIYSEDGETTGGSSSPISNVEYYQKLGERVIKALHEQTAEGHVFRVDMRLRPHGRMAPLGVGLETAIEYYEQTGQAWERQALLKTRPVAGDLALGERFLERTRPFVYPRYFDDETLEDISQVKQQMESLVEGRGQTETEVKLGRGGIRDIEFTVQILQLLNGGRIPALQVRSTLEAIDVLGRHDLLGALEARDLASNYVFMRRVEHRIQIEGSQQRHALPTDPGALDMLGRRLGYDSGTSFMAAYRRRAEATRAILERFLSVQGSGNLWISHLLNPLSEAEDGLERLGAMGFADPEKAREELLLLCSGPAQRPHSSHVRRLFTAIAPDLLEALSAGAEPDATLLRLGHLLATLRASGPIYDILKQSPRLCKFFVRLLDNSEYLTHILISDPGLFDSVGTPGALEAAPSREELERRIAGLRSAYDAEAAPYRFHSGEILRIGMRDLFTDVSVRELGEELTAVAEVCLSDALAAARAEVVKRYGAATGGFAILGLGKLGGREMGYGSDLDLIFVFEDGQTVESGMAPSEYYAAIGTRLLRALKERTRHGVLYDVDARLRPDGKKGTLVISMPRVHDYYANEAQPWERLALMKARAVAGDTEFAQRVEEAAQAVAYHHPLSAPDVANIDEVRQRIVANASPLDLKKREGGIAELEFGIRLLQLKYAVDEPRLRRVDVGRTLKVLAEVGVLAAAETQSLYEAYEFLRRLENRIRMMRGRSGSTLPEEPEEQKRLAERLGLEGDLLVRVQETRDTIHAFYEKVLATVAPSE